MISVLTVSFGLDMPYPPGERDPQPTAWFHVRLERLLPRPGGRPRQSVDEPAFVRQLAAHEAGGRAAGECPKVARQMRLIGIAADICQLCPACDLIAPQLSDGVIEPQNAGEQLWRHAELAPEADAEVLPAPTEFLSQRGHPNASGTGLQPLQSPD